MGDNLMKKVLKFKNLIAILLLIVVISQPAKSFAAQSNYIVIDGADNDWNQIGDIRDDYHDSTGETELKWMKFQKEEDNLYILVDRFNENNHGEFVEWDLFIPILNANKTKYTTTQIKLPWQNKATNEVVIKVKAVYSNKKYMTITISLGNKVIQRHYYRTNNPHTLEFAIPLAEIGLNQDSDDVEFALAANNGRHIVDWIPDKGPIKITGGPVFGSMTPVITILGICIVALIATKKKELYKL